VPVTRAREQTRWRSALAWWPFLLLCVLGAVRWLAAAQWPVTATTLSSSSAGCGVAALITFAMGWRLQRVSRTRSGASHSLVRNAVGGALLIGGPAIGMVLLPHGLDATSLMTALALTPVVIGVACVAVGEECESLAGNLWPGLVVLSGILLVVPQPSLADPAADIAMMLAPIMTGVGTVMLSQGREQQPSLTAARAVTALSAAALFLGVFAVVRFGAAGARESFAPVSALLDGATAWLAVKSVQRLGAVRSAAQFALVPLAVLLEGLVLMRPSVTLRTGVGLALMLLAGIVLAVRGGKEGSAAVESLNLA
jgi:drug/metabolite transporter (DMT)-like permease